MDSQQRKDPRHAALASDVRRRVLELVLESASPLDAAAVAERIALHVTTVRFHLDQLESAGLVRRTLERSGTRGRPRVLFVADPSAHADVAQGDLTEALAGALAEDSDGGRARSIRAGEAWSERYDGELTASVGDTEPLMRVLGSLGFDPVPAAESRSDDGGRVVELRACPFRDEARRNPDVICAVHLGLVRGAARSLGHDADDAGLRPFVEPDLCLVELRGAWG